MKEEAYKKRLIKGLAVGGAVSFALVALVVLGDKFVREPNPPEEFAALEREAAELAVDLIRIVDEINLILETDPPATERAARAGENQIDVQRIEDLSGELGDKGLALIGVLENLAPKLALFSSARARDAAYDSVLKQTLLAGEFLEYKLAIDDFIQNEEADSKSALRGLGARNARIKSLSEELNLTQLLQAQ